MLRSKSASRLLGGAAAALLLAADLAGLRAGDEQFQLPLPAASDPSVTANFPTGDVPPGPAAAPANTRWAQRNQQMQAAAAQGTMGTPQYAGFAATAGRHPAAAAGSLAAAWGHTDVKRVSAASGPACRQTEHSQRPLPNGAYMAPRANGEYMNPAANGSIYWPRRSQRLPFSGRFNSSTARPGVIPDNLPEAEQVKTPSQLPRVTQIMPSWTTNRIRKWRPRIRARTCVRVRTSHTCKTADGKGPECPNEVPLSNGPVSRAVFPASTYTWQASNVFYQPLYFEDPDLEHYGHTWPFFIQPIVSSLRFTTQAIGIPYQMTIDPCCCRVYPLGYYRPGECAPKLFYQIPWNTEAAAVEAGSIAGVYFLFPHSAWSTAGGIASP